MASVVKTTLLPATALTATNTGETKVLEPFSDKFVGYLHVSAINGATTVASKIQHSADGSNWIDHTSFANLVGVTGFEAVNITASFLPYVRSVVTLSGATQAATVTMSLYFDKIK